MKDYFRPTVLLLFLALVFYLFCILLGGCASSDIEKYVQMKYPDCEIIEVEKTPYTLKVIIVCLGKEPIIKTYSEN